ncbi:MAG: pentapeptide repeat-containing protein [Parcubacteria group bacterium]|nr:pentapeptide repeat-containing protein [Parcubacteria group bacterium]
MPVEIKNLDGKVMLVYEADTLVGADLKNKNLTKVDFRNMDLGGINLEYAHCRGADFSGANLKNAYMPYAQCMEAIFHGTDFENANIERVRFDNADLRNAINLEKVARDFRARFDGAILPDGTRHSSTGDGK